MHEHVEVVSELYLLRTDSSGRSSETRDMSSDRVRTSVQNTASTPGERRPVKAKASMRPARWSLYMVRTANGALYTGVSNDVDRRFAQHAKGSGAKALRGRGPLVLVYRVAIGDRAAAQRVEHALKQLSKAEKEAVVVAQPKRRRWASVLRVSPVRAKSSRRAPVRP